MKKCLSLLLLLSFLICGSPTVLANGASPREESEGHVDELVIEDAYLEYDPKESYKCPIYVKVRLDFQIPEYSTVLGCFVEADLIDKNDTILPGEEYMVGGLRYPMMKTGQSEWNTSVLSLKQEKIDQIDSIKLSAYMIGVKSATEDVLIRGVFSEPVVLSMQELLNGPHTRPKEPSITFENVSIEYTDTLPEFVTSSIAFEMVKNASREKLDERETYAALRFTVTNHSMETFDLIDGKTQFEAALDTSGWYFRTGARHPSYFIKGSSVNLVDSGFHGIADGGIQIEPSASEDILIYMVVAKALAAQTDKPLKVYFTYNIEETEWYEVKIR